MQSVGAPFGKSLFVLGGARSGKSRHAQAVAEASVAAPEAAGTVTAAGKESQPARLVYIATAQAFDDEMTNRIARHRADRDTRWRTIEAPLALPAALTDADGADTIMLVDCLTLWVSNLLLAEHPVSRHVDALVATIARLEGRVIIVSNEVGLGIVPDNVLARRFRDAAGLLHQRIAAQVDSVDVMAAGLVQRWKGPSLY